MADDLNDSDHGTAPSPDTCSPRDGRFSEVELKLTGDADVLSAVFDRSGGGVAPGSRVVSTYYDTTDCALWRKGFAFRLRPHHGRYELTLKRERGLVRSEWKSDVCAPVVDFARLPDDAPHDELRSYSSGLVPLFASEVTRRQTRFRAGDAWMELSLDVGRILAGGRQERITELEFELQSGPVADMLRHVRTIVADRRLSVFTCSKAARGMLLVDNGPPAHARAPRTHLDADDTVDDAVRHIVAGVSTQILENVPLVTAGCDGEAIHQLRVALRRLRTLIGLFRPYLGPRAIALEEVARGALRRLGAVRDLDVLVSETLPSIRRDGVGERGPADLAAGARKRMVDARMEVGKLVFSPSFNCFLIDLLLVAHCGGLVTRNGDMPVGSVAKQLLQERHRQLLRAGRNFSTLTDRQRHEVRIAAKKLRYACDFFRALYPADSTRAYIRRLAKLQNHLGRFNDLMVGERLAAELLGNGDRQAVSAATVKRLCEDRRRANESLLLRNWERAARAKAFWR